MSKNLPCIFLHFSTYNTKILEDHSVLYKGINNPAEGSFYGNDNYAFVQLKVFGVEDALNMLQKIECIMHLKILFDNEWISLEELKSRRTTQYLSYDI